MSVAVMLSKADLDDQRWLDHQVETLGDGIEAARAIWQNWTDLRNVGRLHPGQSPGDYIASLGFRLTLAEAMAALPDGSTREIAKVAGVSNATVSRQRGVADVTPDDQPARVIGADGKSYPGRVVREVPAEVIEPDDETDLDAGPNEEARHLAYVEALRSFIAGVIRVQPPTLGDPPSSYRRRHELERRLQAVLTEVMS